ncbi:hypothetical protein BKA62DRAFT_717290 [Auriculariales sp. MPI-PUGE-AT-0066]|nr:hypothetical protein BKA62DRAFT_717290 [Auriculariales sp. MPI-PUGE-AT-0066]
MSQAPSPIAHYPDPSHVRLIRAPLGPRPISSASSPLSQNSISAAQVLSTIPDDEDDEFLHPPMGSRPRLRRRGSNLSDATSFISHATFSTLPTPGFDLLMQTLPMTGEPRRSRRQRRFSDASDATSFYLADDPSSSSSARLLPVGRRPPSISPSVRSSSAGSIIARKSRTTFGPRIAGRRSSISSTATARTTGAASVQQNKSLLTVRAPFPPTAFVHVAPRLTAPSPAVTAQHHHIDSENTALNVTPSLTKPATSPGEVAILAKDYPSRPSTVQLVNPPSERISTVQLVSPPSIGTSTVQLVTPPPSPLPTALMSPSSSSRSPSFTQKPEMERSPSPASYYEDEKDQSHSPSSVCLGKNETLLIQFQPDLERRDRRRKLTPTLTYIQLVKALFALIALAAVAVCIYEIVIHTKQ